MTDRVLILDFGAQYTQLIARRLRELAVLAEILPFDTPPEELAARHPSGIILSGGPRSVSDHDAPRCNPAVFDLQVSSSDDRTVIEMHLALEQERTGRPLSVLAALEIDAEPIEVARTSLEIDRPQLAMRAWREGGRVEG